MRKLTLHDRSNLSNTMIKMALIITIILMAELPINCGASYPELTFQYENNAWKIIYSFSEYRGEPNDVIDFNIEISAKTKIYDLKVWVQSPHLHVTNEEQDSNIHYGELSEGDVVEEVLRITIPETAQYNEIYSINIKVESHLDLSIGGIRIPYLDNPEHVFNNEDIKNYDFKIKIEKYPILKVEDDSTLLQLEQYNDYKIRIKNIGSIGAEDVYYNIVVPNNIELKDDHEGYLGTIESNSYKDIIIQIKPSEIGDYIIELNLMSSNHKNVNYKINIKIQDYNIWLYGLLIAGIIVIIVIKIFIWWMSSY